MREIIYNLWELQEASTPITFISDNGIDKTEVEEIIKDIKEVMESDPTIVSLAAPQIGIKKRIFCIRFNDTIKTFINPIITKKSGCLIGPETYLTLKGKEILIARPEEVSVVYYNDEFKYEDNKLVGIGARIFDQMAQLLDGILPTDLGLVSDIEEDGSIADATEEEQKAIIECYKQFVAAKTKAYVDEINKDETDTKLYNNLRFTESVINGKTQVVEEEPAEKNYNRAQRRAMSKQDKKITKQIAKEKK